MRVQGPPRRDPTGPPGAVKGTDPRNGVNPSSSVGSASWVQAISVRLRARDSNPARGRQAPRWLGNCPAPYRRAKQGGRQVPELPDVT